MGFPGRSFVYNSLSVVYIVVGKLWKWFHIRLTDLPISCHPENVSNKHKWNSELIADISDDDFRQKETREDKCSI